MTHLSSALSINQLCNDEESKKEEGEIMNASELQTQQHFVHRIPLVNTALKAYENSSSAVKYGAEMLGSYASPIYDKLGSEQQSDAPLLVKESNNPDDDDTTAAMTALARTSLYDNTSGTIHHRINQTKDRKSRPCSRSTSPHRPYQLHNPAKQQKSNINQHSRWQQIVLHAGSAAGTTAAVISEESMKCIRYCLSWLHYSIQRIEQQMDLLRNFLVSLVKTTSSNDDKSSDSATTMTAATTRLTLIKKEIVDTLRKVVEVVSKYAGSGLPEQAKASVRTFILQLPNRWAVLNSSESSTICLTKSDQDQDQTPLHETSIRLLDFGGESIEMLKSVSVVFSDTIERAELWLKRLKVVGQKVNRSTATSPMEIN